MLGAAVLALTIGVMARRSVNIPAAASPEELRDAVASPISPALLGAARVMREPNAGYFASPADRRAEAEKALLSSRLTKVSRSMQARAARLRVEAARERALSVSAQ